MVWTFRGLLQGVSLAISTLSKILWIFTPGPLEAVRPYHFLISQHFPTWNDTALSYQGSVHTMVKMGATMTVTCTTTLCNMKVLFTPITSEQKQNGYRGFCTPLDHPFIVLVVLCRCQQSTNSTSKTLLRWSRGSLSWLLSWSSLLVLPPFQDVIRSLRTPHRFWAVL